MVAKKAAEKVEAQGWIGRLKPIAKWGIVLLVVLFLGLTIRRAYIDIQRHSEHLDLANMNVRWMALGVLAYAVGMIPASLAWLQTLKSFKQIIPFWAAMNAYFLEIGRAHV